MAFSVATFTAGRGKVDKRQRWTELRCHEHDAKCHIQILIKRVTTQCVDALTVSTNN